MENATTAGLTATPPTVQVKFDGEGRVTLPNAVRFNLYRHPDVPGTTVHDTCGHTMHDHGWIDPAQSFHVQHKDGIIICPPRVPFGEPTIPLKFDELTARAAEALEKAQSGRPDDAHALCAVAAGWSNLAEAIARATPNGRA